MTISQTMQEAINGKTTRISIAEIHWTFLNEIRYSTFLDSLYTVCIWHIKPKPKHVQYGITIWSNLTKEVSND
jgi:hypothetical protein